MGNNITKNNHYVPQFYLRNWSKDGKTIFVYRTLVSDKEVPLWTRTSIEHIASHQHLYTILVDGEPNDYYEKWFNSEFETPAQPAIEKVIRGIHLTYRDYELLIQFLAAQIVRTPKWHASINDHISEIFPNALKQTVDKLEDTIKSQKSLPSLSQKVSDRFQIHIKITPEEDTDTSILEAKLYTGQKMWLTRINVMLPKIVSVLKKNSWTILEAANNQEFPTSDDPVVCMGYRNSSDYWFKGVGLKQKNANIFMPLTPKHLLFTEVGHETKARQINYEFNTLINEVIIKHANRNIFSTSKIKGMLALHPRIINPTLFNEEQAFWRTWLESQRDAEQNWDSESNVVSTRTSG